MRVRLGVLNEQVRMRLKIEGINEDKLKIWVNQWGLAYELEELSKLSLRVTINTDRHKHTEMKFEVMQNMKTRMKIRDLN